jgi:hypothetical protein
MDTSQASPAFTCCLVRGLWMSCPPPPPDPPHKVHPKCPKGRGDTHLHGKATFQVCHCASDKTVTKLLPVTSQDKG